MSEVHTLQSRIAGLFKFLAIIGIVGGLYYANEQGLLDGSEQPKERVVHQEKWAEEERVTRDSFFEFINEEPDEEEE